MAKATPKAGLIHGGRAWHMLVNRGRMTACTGVAAASISFDDFLHVGPQCGRCLAAYRRMVNPKRRARRAKPASAALLVRAEQAEVERDAWKAKAEAAERERDAYIEMGHGAVRKERMLGDKTDRLAAALQPFAAAASDFESFISDAVVADTRTGCLRVGDFRRARAALAEPAAGQEDTDAE